MIIGKTIRLAIGFKEKRSILGFKKKRSPFEQARDNQVIEKIAREKIYSLEDGILFVPCLNGDQELIIYAKNPGEDYNALLQELNSAGYIIR